MRGDGYGVVMGCCVVGGVRLMLSNVCELVSAGGV
jgi:hypothetical protein